VRCGQRREERNSSYRVSHRRSSPLFSVAADVRFRACRQSRGGAARKLLRSVALADRHRASRASVRLLFKSYGVTIKESVIGNSSFYSSLIIGIRQGRRCHRPYWKFMPLQFGRNGLSGLRGELRLEIAMIRSGNYPSFISNSNVPHQDRIGVMQSLATTRQHPGEYGQQVVEIAVVAAPVGQSAALRCYQHTLTVDEWKIVKQVPATIPFLPCNVFHRCGPGVSWSGAIIIWSRRFNAKPVSTHRTSDWHRSVPDYWHETPSVRT
jgi:hypothetical protein